MAVWCGRRLVRAALTAALCVAGYLGRAGAQAAPLDRTFSLDYRAPASCPKASAVAGAIQARSEGASSVSTDAASVRLTIELLPSGQSKLWVDVAEGSFHREFVASSCVDAVASMAVIAAMVLEAEPAARRAMADAGLQTFPDPVPEPTQPEARVLAQELPSLQVSAEAPPLPKPQPARRVARPSKLRWAASAAAALETAVAPSPPWGVKGGLEAYFETKTWLTPSVLAELLVTGTGLAQTAAGQGEFSLLAGHLKGCPIRLPASGPWRVLPCASLEVGSLYARGTGNQIQNSKSTSMLWLAFGASLRGQLDILRLLSLEASLDLKGLGQRDKFVFNPDPGNEVYQVPLVSLGVGIGLLLRLP